MTALVFISLVLSVLASCVVVSYEEYAQVGGWPVGGWFRGASVLKGLAGLNALGVVVVVWLYYSFLWALGVFVTGWILSFFFIIILKHRAQVSSLIIFLIGYALQFFIA